MPDNGSPSYEEPYPAQPVQRLVIPPSQQMMVPRESSVASWQPPKSWKPAGPARLPYSQPWQRQGQVALDNCIKHIAELKCLLEERTRERDNNLALAKEANDMLTALSAEKGRVEQALEAARLESEQARDEADKARAEHDAAMGELGQLTAAKRSVDTELQQTQAQLQDTIAAKDATQRALKECTEANAAMMQQSMRSQAETAAAQAVLSKIECDRAAEVAIAEQKERDAEEAALREEQEHQAAEADRKRKALVGLTVQPDTRKLIEAEMERFADAGRSTGRGGRSAAPKAAAETDHAVDELTRYNDPEEIFSLLEPHGPTGRPFCSLIRASWLRAKKGLDFLPTRQSDLPPEAFITASELRKIYKQMKLKQKLLPIISVLHPAASPLSKAHPDEHGVVLKAVCNALDDRWDQFTRKRGTGGDSGVADLGIFFDWVALDESRSKETLHDGFGLWYAHELTTVWMMPESIDPLTKQLSYTNGWATFEHHVSTFFKASSDLSGHSGPWPQLLTLDNDGDLEESEQVHRPSPCEPLAFRPGHQHGDSSYKDGDEERKVVEEMYRDTLLEMLGASRKLTFNRLGWVDDDACRLALVLPLAPQIRELHLAANEISDKSLLMLTQSLGALGNLEVLNLSSNRIGDPGASRLSGAFTDGVLKSSLKSLDLSANHIGDKGALTLAASISGGALVQCKKVNLKGNPVSVTAKKQVAKSLKKRAKKAE